MFLGSVRDALMLFPLTIAGMCIVASIIGTFFVRLGPSKNIMGALYKGVIATGVLSLIDLWTPTDYLDGRSAVLTTSGGLQFTGMNLFECGIGSLVVKGALTWITE